MSKQQLQSYNNQLASLIEELKGKAVGGGEDVSAETTEYTAQLDELEEVIDSLPDAGSAGNVETCTVVINATGVGIYRVLAEVYENGTISNTVNQYVGVPNVTLENVVIGKRIIVGLDQALYYMQVNVENGSREIDMGSYGSFIPEVQNGGTMTVTLFFQQSGN